MTKDEEKMVMKNYFLTQAILMDYCKWQSISSKEKLSFDDVLARINGFAKDLEGRYNSQNN